MPSHIFLFNFDISGQPRSSNYELQIINGYIVDHHAHRSQRNLYLKNIRFLNPSGMNLHSIHTFQTFCMDLHSIKQRKEIFFTTISKTSQFFPIIKTPKRRHCCDYKQTLVTHITLSQLHAASAVRDRWKRNCLSRGSQQLAVGKMGSFPGLFLAKSRNMVANAEDLSPFASASAIQMKKSLKNY